MNSKLGTILEYLGYAISIVVLASAIVCSRANAAEVVTAGGPSREAPPFKIQYAPPGVALSDDMQVFRVIDTEVGAVCYVAAVDGAKMGLADPIATGISCFKIDLVKKPTEATPPVKTPTTAPKTKGERQ